ncbi:major capsid protein [Castellaniella sp.]|uniref:major capsid protein n=1 Tax=Castellaniella sp. TaxID=1955812 RepID=UPI00355FFBD7
MASILTTLPSDMKVYDTLAQTAYLERIQDVLQVFNAQSAGAIVLRNEVVAGDFTKDAFYKIGGEIEHRDVTSTAEPDTKKVGSDEMIGVKTPWKYGPYQSTEEAFKRRARNVDEFFRLVGQDMADAVLAYYIKLGFASLVGSITKGGMTDTASWASDKHKVLTKLLRKFGDRFTRIAVFAMDANEYFDMVDNAITEKVFEEAGVVIYGGSPGTLGRPVLVSDQIPANRIFGLQAGAVTITESQAPGIRSYPINDQENLAVGYRAEGAFNIDVLGYSWTKQSDPENPGSADLGSSTNWTQYATSSKATAGAIITLAGGGASASV